MFQGVPLTLLHLQLVDGLWKKNLISTQYGAFPVPCCDPGDNPDIFQDIRDAGDVV